VKPSPAFCRLALLALAAVLAALPARAQDVGADTPINLPTPPGVRIYSDLAYEDQGGPRQRLDLYLPFPVPAKPMPLIVFLHGGGWRKGSKADGRAFAFRMVARGYAVACPNFRLSSDAPFPAQLQDCKSAVRWLRDNAVRYRLDASHFGAAGVSSGGHLAALLGASGSNHLFDSLGHMGASSSVQAACVFFGPIDLLRFHETSSAPQTPQADEVVQLLGGNPRIQRQQAEQANPITHLQGDAPPFLLVHGTEDTVVPPGQSRLFYDELAKRRIPVHLHLIHGAGHTGPAFVAPEINAMVDEFFSRWLKPVPRPFEAVTATITESTAREN